MTMRSDRGAPRTRRALDSEVRNAAAVRRSADKGSIAILRRLEHRLGLGLGASPSPTEALGPDHPLVLALDLIGVLLRQSLATSLALVLCAAAVVLGADWARPPLVAAVTVQLVLAALLATAWAHKRERARDAIIEDRDVWLPALERERQRLLRRREGLAAAVESLVYTTERWHRVLPASRPIYNPLLARHAGPELLAIATRLRSTPIDVRGIARCERLLTSGTSPLFGSEPDEWQAELARIRSDLNGRGPSAVAAEFPGRA